jgi:folate-dependent phosphoribosylglycinamide formyltransferase PurN
MELSQPKIVIWCGAAANQKALVNKIVAKYNVSGIVIDTHAGGKKKRKWNKMPELIWDRILFRKIYGAWNGLMKYYEDKFSEWPDVPRMEVQNINDHAAEKFSKKLSADLVVVSGTALIKEPLVSLPASKGIINLHTGLSPYVKGGPNCTNWCIANNSFHLTGNTIMWLNAGIDSGNIITTETVNIKNAASLTEAHLLVMEHAHDLYLRAIDYLIKTEGPYNSVQQETISKGTLYLTKMWTRDKKQKLLSNWKKRKSFSATELPITVSLKPERK